MPSKSINNMVNVLQTINPAVFNTTTNGVAVDSKDYESVEHIIAVGNAGDTWSGTIKIDLTLQDSDDGTNFVAVTNNGYVVGDTVDGAGVFMSLQNGATHDLQRYRVGYVGPKRYSRVILTFGGTHTNGSPIGAVAVLSHPRVAPTPA